MQVPFFTSTREYMDHKAELDASVQSVMAHGGFILGKDVEVFEQACARRLGVRFALGVASGSDALVLASDVLGFRDGTEVLTPTFTFFASTSCVARLGGKPVFVDLDEETLNMDLHNAENRITKATRGIIPVHLFLQSTDMGQVMALAQKHNLKVLEDSAEAFGMETFYDGAWKSAGTIGDAGVYSFFPTKTLGGYGDAGLLVTNNEELYLKFKSYRVHGSSVRYQHDYIGYNSRLDTMQAAILNVKLKYIDQAIVRRAEHAKHYRDRLSSIPALRFPTILPGNREVNYVFNILSERRDELAEHLKNKGIGYSIYYPIPLHLQKCFAYLGHKPGDFPVAEKVCSQILALPMFPELLPDEVDYVCDAILEFFGIAHFHVIPGTGITGAGCSISSGMVR
jgi:dTDP-4-amino-4,6-dideoxygalactose transaminase